MRFGHLVDRLDECAIAQPERTVFTYSEGEESDSRSLTYGTLRRRATALAGCLQRSYAPGERALLLFPAGLDFMEAFFGCVYAGLIAVPVCPPRRFRPADHIAAIVENARPAVVLSNGEYASHRAEWFARIPALLQPPWLATDAAGEGEGCAWCRPDLAESSIALLQYTSGTTGSPKGVMVSHGNLCHNAETIRRAFGPGDHSRRAFWLPLYHDMGLIGGMLQTVFDGATSAWISPAAFLQRPLSWLELISRTRASISGAPDFAYHYCAQRSTPENRAGLDLSCWNVAVSGAETIRPATIERFSAAFADCGFRRQAFQPGYGLAEATLVVSNARHGVDPTTVCLNAAAVARNQVEPREADGPGARLVASSGQVGHGQDVVIVDGTTKTECADGQVGEIWVAGPNVAQGYYNNPVATAATFQASLPGRMRSFLRTGDLGFLLDGHLYVTGRLKELIVVRGRNLYPQDVEWAVRQADPRVRNAPCAVFSVDLFGSERLVVVQEVERTRRNTCFEELGNVVRRRIGRDCGVEVFDLLFVKPGAIPRTTSGKVRRLQCRADYLAEQIDVVARWTDRLHRSVPAVPAGDLAGQSNGAGRTTDEIRHWLLQRIAERLDLPAEQLDDRLAFSEMGLGSMDMVLICVEFEQWLGRSMPPTMIYNFPTVGALAEHLGEGPKPVLLPLTTPVRDDLRAAVAESSEDELAAFVAREMEKAARADQRRAA